MAKRRAHSEEHENAERWLLTYADMITLLMAFFIMLYAMSQLDIKKFDAMTGAVQAQLGGTGILEGSMNVTRAPEQVSATPGIAPTLSSGAQALQQRLREELQPLVQGEPVRIKRCGAELQLSLPAHTLYFAAGSAEPGPQMLAVLQRLAAILSQGQYSVHVTGHTCNLPVRNAQYQSNWELSADRARNVAFRLIKYGAVSSANCSFMGLADTRPLAPNTREGSRARNRRVEIWIKPLAAETGAETGGCDHAGAAGTTDRAEPAPAAAAGGGQTIDIRPHLERAAH